MSAGPAPLDPPEYTLQLMRGRDTSGLPAADATNAAIDTAQQVCHGHFSQCGHSQQIMPSHQCCAQSLSVWCLLMLATRKVVIVPVLFQSLLLLLSCNQQQDLILLKYLQHVQSAVSASLQGLCKRHKQSHYTTLLLPLDIHNLPCQHCCRVYANVLTVLVVPNRCCKSPLIPSLTRPQRRTCCC